MAPENSKELVKTLSEKEKRQMNTVRHIESVILPEYLNRLSNDLRNLGFTAKVNIFVEYTERDLLDMMVEEKMSVCYQSLVYKLREALDRLEASHLIKKSYPDHLRTVETTFSEIKEDE